MPKDRGGISDFLAKKVKKLKKGNEEIYTSEDQSSVGNLENAPKNVVKGGCG